VENPGAWRIARSDFNPNSFTGTLPVQRFRKGKNGSPVHKKFRSKGNTPVASAEAKHSATHNKDLVIQNTQRRITAGKIHPEYLMLAPAPA
jgi:hypothetical protein